MAFLHRNNYTITDVNELYELAILVAEGKNNSTRCHRMATQKTEKKTITWQQALTKAINETYPNSSKSHRIRQKYEQAKQQTTPLQKQ